MNLTSYVQDRQLTIALRGEIDHHAAREIMQALSAKIDLYLPLRCILDFRDVTFMDSSGIAVVIHTLRRMNTLQGRLLLQNIPPQPYKVLRAAAARSAMSAATRTTAQRATRWNICSPASRGTTERMPLRAILYLTQTTCSTATMSRA